MYEDAMFGHTKDLTREELDQAAKFTREMRPDLWQKCCSRNYEPYRQHEYPNSKCVAMQMMSSTLKVDNGFLEESERHELIWASAMARHRTPQYWVSRDLAEAVMKTTPPFMLDWYNMPVPFPAMSFILPFDVVRHREDGNVNFISFVKSTIGDPVKSISSFGPREWISANGGFLMLANTEGRYMSHWNISYDKFPKIDLRKLSEVAQCFEENVHSTSSIFGSPVLTSEDTRISHVTAHLLFGLLLLMTRKPEILTAQSMLKRVKSKRGEAPREFWSPNILGKDYKIQRAVRNLGGTHASPRYHWVNGSWRTYHVGVGRSESIDKWVEPFERGIDEAGAN